MNVGSQGMADRSDGVKYLLSMYQKLEEPLDKKKGKGAEKEN